MADPPANGGQGPSGQQEQMALFRTLIATLAGNFAAGGSGGEGSSSRTHEYDRPIRRSSERYLSPGDFPDADHGDLFPRDGVTQHGEPYGLQPTNDSAYQDNRLTRTGVAEIYRGILSTAAYLELVKLALAKLLAHAREQAALEEQTVAATEAYMIEPVEPGADASEEDKAEHAALCAERERVLATLDELREGRAAANDLLERITNTATKVYKIINATCEMQRVQLDLHVTPALKKWMANAERQSAGPQFKSDAVRGAVSDYHRQQSKYLMKQFAQRDASAVANANQDKDKDKRRPGKPKPNPKDSQGKEKGPKE